ncbi:hypothetical protein Esti_006696 [Eimeria stiedai]
MALVGRNPYVTENAEDARASQSPMIVNPGRYTSAGVHAFPQLLEHVNCMNVHFPMSRNRRSGPESSQDSEGAPGSRGEVAERRRGLSEQARRPQFPEVSI